MGAQQPIEASDVGREDQVGQVEGGEHGGVRVIFDPQAGKAVPIDQLVHVLVDSARRVVSDGRGGYAECKGEVGASSGELVNGGWFGSDAVGSEQVGQQRSGFFWGEDVEGEAGGAVAGDQAGEPVPTGDQDQAAGAPGRSGRI